MRMLAALLPIAALAQSVPNHPFTLTGYIEEFQLLGASSADREDVQRARIRVKGIDVTLPENLIIQMPGSYLTAADIFRGPKATAASPILPKSGLALVEKPLAAYEANLIGNILPNGEYVAGMAWISQHSLAGGEGVIAQVNGGANPPEIVVRSGAGGTASVRLRLNDPRGRFGKPHSDDIRFRADDQNPTIISETGYPVCIPASANDPECPAANRPAGAQRWVAGTRPPVSIDPRNPCRDCAITLCPACNPRKPAPLRAGDHIVFSGTIVQLQPERIISVHTLDASLAIYTSPGASPAYVAIEMSRFGTGGVPFQNLPQEQGFGKKLPAPETTTNIKIEGMTTDPSRRVRVFAVDRSANPNADPPETPRFLQALTPAGVPLGRWRQVLDSANHLPPARELRAVVEGEPEDGVAATVRGVAYQLGPYQAPVEEFIFPEGTVPGNNPVPMNFESLCFLADGSGKLETLERSNGVVVRRLSPFPLSGSVPMVQFDAAGNRICTTTFP